MTFNELITKIGVNKLHFSFDGFITALFTIVATLQESVIDTSKHSHLGVLFHTLFN